MAAVNTVVAPHVRPERADDEELVRALYLEDVAADLGPEAAAVVADLQLRAREAHRAATHPHARAEVAELDGRPVGRVLVDTSGGTWRVVDLAVLASARRRGVATALLTPLLAAADRTTHAVDLHVTPSSPARLLYEALGFVVTDAGPTSLLMHRRPQGVHHARTR